MIKPWEVRQGSRAGTHGKTASDRYNSKRVVLEQEDIDGGTDMTAPADALDSGAEEQDLPDVADLDDIPEPTPEELEEIEREYFGDEDRIVTLDDEDTRDEED